VILHNFPQLAIILEKYFSFFMSATPMECTKILFSLASLDQYSAKCKTQKWRLLLFGYFLRSKIMIDILKCFSFASEIINFILLWLAICVWGMRGAREGRKTTRKWEICYFFRRQKLRDTLNFVKYSLREIFRLD
jgi:hypothetical protein